MLPGVCSYRHGGNHEQEARPAHRPRYIKFFLVPPPAPGRDSGATQNVDPPCPGSQRRYGSDHLLDTIPGYYFPGLRANRGATGGGETSATDVSNCLTAPGTLIIVSDVPDLVMRSIASRRAKVPQGQASKRLWSEERRGCNTLAASGQVLLVRSSARPGSFEDRGFPEEVRGPLGPGGATFANTAHLDMRPETVPLATYA